MQKQCLAGTDGKPKPLECEQLRVKKLSEYAMLPTRGSPLSAGFDLYSAHNYVVPAKGSMLIENVLIGRKIVLSGRLVCSTDLAVAVPTGCYGRVAPRSGLAVKHGIDVGAGVVDADYRGTLGVVLFNFGDEDFKVILARRSLNSTELKF